MKKLYLASLLALASFSGAYGIFDSIGRTLDKAAGQVGLGPSVQVKQAAMKVEFFKLLNENQVLKKSVQQLKMMINKLRTQLMNKKG